MNRNYICKSCGRTWTLNDRFSSYLQRCPECSRNTRPEKKPEIIHYTVRGFEPRHVLCNDQIDTISDNFDLVNVTCTDCLEILSKGTGLYGKCYKCRKFTYPTNKRYWRFCISEPLPDEVVFEHTNFLSMDSADKGCTSQFIYKPRWTKFFAKEEIKN